MVDHRSFPYESIPTGWYQVAWSDEVAAGAVVPRRYFDQELVLLRTEGGALRLFDAHCPHMGAHGAVFRVESSFVFGQGKDKTWLTPDGQPRTASLIVEAWGLGCLMARFEIDSSIHIQTTTPIDGEFADTRATVLTPVGELID